MQKNIHSFEMQTDKSLEHFRKMGFTGNIEIVADDEALSGTLDIHKRPGLMRTLQRVENGTLGWIGTVAVNRLTRDPNLVTPTHIMKLCRINGVWIIPLRMQFNNLVAQAEQKSGQERLDLYAQAERVAIDDVGWLPLSHQTLASIIPANLHGVVLNGGGLYFGDWSNVYLS